MPTHYVIVAAIQVSCEFLVVGAAIATRRTRRDPIFWIAVAWGAFALVDLRSILRLVGLIPFYGPELGPIVPPLHGAFVVPAVLAWADRPIARRRVAIGVALVVAVLLPIFWLGAGREYQVVIRPCFSTVAAVLTALALASVVRRARVPLARLDGFWVGSALLLQYFTMLFYFPIVEIVYARNPDAAWGMQDGRLLLESAVSCLMAYGVFLTRRTSAARAPGAPARSAPTLHSA